MANGLRFLGFTTLFSLLSCGGGGGSSSGPLGTYVVRLASGTVDAAGGTVQVSDPASPYAGTSIIVPPGAVASATPITISRTINGTYPSNVFDFKLEPDGQQFAVPVSLTLKYSDKYLSDLGLTNESALQIVQRSSGSGPEVLSTTAQDFANNTITFQTTHFSSFAALAYNNQTLMGEYFVVTWLRLPPVPDPVPFPFTNPPGYVPTRHINETSRTYFDGKGNYTFLGGQSNRDGTVSTMSGTGGTYSVGPTGLLTQTESGGLTVSGAVLLSGDAAVLALPFGVPAEFRVLIRKDGVYSNASLSGDYVRAKIRHDLSSSNTLPPPDPLVDVCVAEPGIESFDGAGQGGLYSVSSDGTIVASPSDPQKGGLALGGQIMVMGSIGNGQDPEITVFVKRAGVFSTASLNGSYVWANFSQKTGAPPPDHWSDSITVTFDGRGELIGNASGALGTYSVAADGAVSLTVPNQTMVGTLFLGGSVLILNGTTHPEIAVALRQSEPPTTTRVSVATGGTQALGGSSFTWPGCLSGNGRYIAFESDATDLVAGDTNGWRDIFVHDRVTQTTTRVSVDSSGNQALLGDSQKPGISADGRFVCFHSAASNLVASDSNGGLDVFVHDRQTGATTRVSVDSMGNQATGGSNTPNMSADGRFVSFSSSAPDLVPSDGNGLQDAFLHDRQTGTTIRVSVDSGEAEAVLGNSAGGPVSDDGNIVVFQSDDPALVASDGNGVLDVFVRDVAAGTTTRVSLSSLGVEADVACGFGGISADGRYICLNSSATTLVLGDSNGTGDVFVHDRQTSQTTRVSVGALGEEGTGGGAGDGRISANGRFVSFTSGATNLVPGDTNGVTDAFVHDRLTGLTTRVSLSSTGQPAGAATFTSSISRDGRFVVFRSGDSTLVPSDTNALTDVFLRGPLF